MKAAVKAMLPLFLRAYLRRRNEAAARSRFSPQWDQAVLLPALPDRPKIARTLLIFPSDPGTIVGAVGDDAMITATATHFRTENPDLQVEMFCIRGPAEQIVRDKGFTPVPLPNLKNFPSDMAEILRQGDHDALVVVGADVMDGYYDAHLSKRLIMTADLAARAGMRALILGFSFNEKAAPELIPCFARLDPRVVLNVRDEISLERITRFAPVQARLVADSAFTLKAGTVDADTSAWIATHRAEGRRVIGINMHPMLVRNTSAEQIARMVDRMAKAIGTVSGKDDIAWLLLPHDYRDAIASGDGIALRPLYARLQVMPGIRSRYFEGEHRAATLKALAGLLDGVVTGRMHLAIAALGMGVPTLGLSYQGKFEGLYRHFSLPLDFLLPPAIFEGDTGLAKALERFLAELPVLTATVTGKLDGILALAEKNFTEAGHSIA